METENYKYQEIPNDSMSTQINVRFSEPMLKSVRSYAKANGFSNVQEFIKETVRKEVFDEEELTQKEVDLVLKVLKVSQEKNLFVSEEKLFEKLRRK